ncbi:uncharacterized protein LOC134826499 isoform X2 [Bolinopsis microptera]|uniref:uncharacterized protein LOC134826499 isoform X2 n=1 Tax=Bolinopsis microptera TaxID=2820187 RepID=UPI003078B0F8
MAQSSKGCPGTFQSEITHLMTRAGDLFNPCAASCVLIEKEMLGELEDLAQRLIQSAGMRSSTIIEPDDFAFQMRQNVSKLYRLNEYLTKRSLLRNKLRKKFDEEDVSVHPDLELDIVNKPWKRRKAMSGTEYEEYTHHYPHSFLKDSCEISAHFSKLIPNPYSLAKECAPIVGYLAHEMVQQWVEAATRIYKDMKKMPCCQFCLQPSSGTSSSTSTEKSSASITKVSVLPCLQPLHFNEVLRRFYNSNTRHSLFLL